MPQKSELLGYNPLTSHPISIYPSSTVVILSHLTTRSRSSEQILSSLGSVRRSVNSHTKNLQLYPIVYSVCIYYNKNIWKKKIRSSSIHLLTTTPKSMSTFRMRHFGWHSIRLQSFLVAISLWFLATFATYFPQVS